MGIDFDKLSYAEQQELIQEQLDDAEAATLAANNDEKSITSELSGVSQRIGNFIKRLSKVVEANDFSSTEAVRRALISNDLGDSGWIRTYCRQNQRILGSPASSVTLLGYDQNELNNFDVGRKYYKELSTLSDMSYHTNQLVIKLAFEGIFNRLKWVENFKSGGYDLAMYGQIDVEIEAFSWLLNRDISEISDAGAENFYRQYQDRLIAGGSPMSRDELVRRYRQERIKDYQADIRKRGIQCLQERSNGTYSIKADWYTKMSVIDSYTNILTRQKPKISTIEEYVEECERVLSEKLYLGEKQLKLPACQSAAAAFCELAETVRDFAQAALDEYELFLEGKDAPYCFMHNPDALKSAKAKYSFNPCKDNPWDHGTSLKDLYWGAADSLGKQCQEFVTKGGQSHLRD